MELEFKKFVCGISETCRRSRLSKPRTSMENPKRFSIYQGIKTASKPLSGQEIRSNLPVYAAKNGIKFSRG